jgi:hypothetical protein
MFSLLSFMEPETSEAEAVICSVAAATPEICEDWLFIVTESSSAAVLGYFNKFTDNVDSFCSCPSFTEVLILITAKTADKMMSGRTAVMSIFCPIFKLIIIHLLLFRFKRKDGDKKKFDNWLQFKKIKYLLDK